MCEFGAMVFVDVFESVDSSGGRVAVIGVLGGCVGLFLGKFVEVGVVLVSLVVPEGLGVLIWFMGVLVVRVVLNWWVGWV